MKYDNLPIVPSMVAEIVAEKLPSEQLNEFVLACDKRCRAAYRLETPWFMECINNRDRMYMWVSHWLKAYKKNT